MSVKQKVAVVAVSGGVDSLVLLHMLVNNSLPPQAVKNNQLSNSQYVVAHFNHGIRRDSDLDEKLVQETAQKYGLIFEVERANLGPGASEETARQARYKFLKDAGRKHKAIKIITAHHQDDWIETVLINIVRGTGRQGVSAMLNNPKVLRPLINIPKADLLLYAARNDLIWREDSTNQNQDYLRNHLRTSVLSKLTPVQKQALLNNLDKVAKTNVKIDKELAIISHKQFKSLNRQVFSSLPTEVGLELIVFLLRQIGVKDYDKSTINRLSLAIKTAKPNSKHPVKDSTYLDINSESALFITP